MVFGRLIRTKTDAFHFYTDEQNNPYTGTLEIDNGVMYLVNGLLHREDGPAIELKNNRKEWYKNGRRHREDGPAFDCPICGQYYHINGNLLSEQKFNAWVAKKEAKELAKILKVKKSAKQQTRRL